MSVRTQRVAKLMHREIADILVREFPDKSMVTVTGVRVTKDLSIVHVDLSVMLDSAEARQNVFDTMVSQASAVRKFLAQRVRHHIRSVPSIRFCLDNSQDQIQKLDTLFAQIRDRENQA